MAHEITTIEDVDQFVQGNSIPQAWHQLGKVLDKGKVSRHDVAEFLPAVLNVDAVPLIAVIDGQQFEIEGKSITLRRTASGGILPVDVVGREFTSNGPSKFFDLVDRICDSPGGDNMATCGLLRGAKTLFADVPIDAATFSVTGASSDEHTVHLLLRQHLSSYKVDSASTSMTCTVCANTERASLDSALAMLTARHNAQEQANLAETAASYLGIVAAESEALKMVLQDLAKTKPTREQVDTVLGRLFESVDGETTRAESRRNNRLETILGYMDGNGIGTDVTGIRGTGYGLYNGITQYVTHDRGRESDKKIAAKLGITGALPVTLKQFESVQFGSGADILARTPDVLTAVLLR